MTVPTWLVAEFCSRLAAVCEAMAGERLRVEFQHVTEPPGADALRWRQTFSGIEGAIWVTAPEADWTAVAGQVLRAAGIEENDAATLKSTFLELAGQALSGLAQTLSARLGREIGCNGGEETADSPQGTSWISVRCEAAAIASTLIAGFETSLLDALAEHARGPAPEKSRNFDLLLEVELPVSVSFGRAQVALKDILKLTTGSVVELNRSAGDLVEVIVNNCVIARGEVVVVEGNFGVRIKQVVSQQERLRTLN